MANDTHERSWPLALEGEAVLEISTDSIAVTLEPVTVGEGPHLVVTGEEVDRVLVEIAQAHDRVRVRLATGTRVLDNLIAGRTRAIARVPANVTARVHADAGAVDVRDLGPCRLDLSADAGRVALANVHGHLKLAADAGQVKGTMVGGSLDVRTDAGAISLHIDQLDPGEHRIRTDVGAVRLELEPGLAVRVETRSGLGSARCTYPSTANAAAVLRVSTDIGSVRVHPAGAAEGDAPGESSWFSGASGSWWGQRDEEADGRHDRGGGSTRRGPWRGRGPMPPVPPMPPMPPGMFGRSRRAGQAPPGTPVPPGRDRPEDPEVARILRMVESGELSARDAEELLQALNHE